MSYEQRFLEKNPRSPVEARPENAFEPNSYEPRALGETPYVATKLGILLDFKVDEAVQIKVAGVDEYIRSIIQNEGLHDSEVSYAAILERSFSKLGQPIERMVTAKRGLQVLDFLFQEASLQEELSAKSHFQALSEKYKHNRVSRLLHELEGSLPIRSKVKA